MENQKPPTSGNPSLRETLEDQRITARDQIAAAWQLHVNRLEEQIASGWKDHVEHVIEERFQEATGRVEEAFAREMESRLAELRQRIRRELADRLNQMLRHVCKSENGREMHTNILEACAMFCQRAALFQVEGQMLRCDGSRDYTADSGGVLGDMVIPLTSAPALVSAVEGADTVIVARTAAELSEQLAGFLGEAPEKKAGIFPIVVRGKTAGLLCAAAVDGDVEVGGLELIAMLAGVALEARSATLAPAPSVVQEPAPASVVRIVQQEADWASVPSADRPVHLRAQRFARARVAEMRLYQASKVRIGRAQADLYSALKDEMDVARDSFKTEFTAACPSMVDYLHLELLRTLANDNASLLGPYYPGPVA